MLGIQRFDDIDRCLVHPDTEIGSARRQPHLRADGHGVRVQAEGYRRPLMQVCDQTVEGAADAAALFAVPLLHLD